jgi:FAD/FMN-containing dehydrogenase
MLDLSRMKGIFVDPGRRTVRAQGGVTWGEFNRETQLHGLATTGGAVSTTGIAGLTLGGGLGWLMGKYGVAADNLMAAEVVTAQGEVVRASADENSDLFWGLRGFAHRRESYNLMVVSEWLDPGDDEKNIAWARATYDALRPHMARESYANYQTEDESEGALEQAYGPNYDRLVALKNTLDPTNFFHLNSNVKPTV